MLIQFSYDCFPQFDVLEWEAEGFLLFSSAYSTSYKFTEILAKFHLVVIMQLINLIVLLSQSCQKQNECSYHEAPSGKTMIRTKFQEFTKL